MLIVNPRLKIPLAEFTFTFSRSSGPGGQNVNKVSSKATLRWRVADSKSLPADVRSRFLSRFRSRITADGEVLLSSQRYRDAPRNVADCLDKLRRMLSEAAAVPKRRKPTRPTRGSIRRRLEQKRRRSLKKQIRRGGAET